MFGSETHLPMMNAPFPAHITAVAVSGGQNRYAWTEQTINPTTGGLQDASPARSGTTTSGYALELGNQSLTTPFYATMRLRGVSGGQPVYEFQAPGGGASLAVYNGASLIDGAVTRIDADTNSVLTWSEIAAGHVQFVVAAATTLQDGIVTIAAQSFKGAKTFSDYPNSASGASLSLGGSTQPGGTAKSESLYGDSTDNGTTTYLNLGNYGLNQPGLTIWSNSNLVNPCFSVYDTSHTLHSGAWGTSGGGDTVAGGIITAIGTGPTTIDGGTWT